MALPTAQELFDAGVHIGHQVRCWNPRFREFLYANRHGISIINLEKTLIQLEKACAYVEHIVGGGQDIWLVGTKPQAQDAIREAATAVSMPFVVERWLGGTLTNFHTIYQGLEKYRNFLTLDQRGEIDRMPNKEAASLRRKMVRMKANFEGLADIHEPPAALFIVDVNCENIAVKEARKMGIKSVALVDTNSDPSCVDIAIPANDDSTRSIGAIVGAIWEAIGKGMECRDLRQVDKAPAQDVGELQDVESSVTLSSGVQMAMDALEDIEVAEGV
ncbi:MAG: 30S ribosomal protein S2 [Puniceicoccales bacterium]|jgi:small subunit ribosomal protein S2|nr:30S ribosomal protein S2 [Puniceicoccales bacterium]